MPKAELLRQLEKLGAPATEETGHGRWCHSWQYHCLQVRGMDELLRRLGRKPQQQAAKARRPKPVNPAQLFADALAGLSPEEAERLLKQLQQE